MRQRVFLILILLASSCAIPRTQNDFSVSGSGLDGEPVEFSSSTDLKVAGLVSEGLGFAATGRLMNAEARLRQALYLEPKNDRIVFDLAMILNQAGQSEESLQLLSALLEKDPGNPTYLQAIADVWVSQGRYDMARQRLKEAFAIYSAARNLPRAALLARSIANINFGMGLEQEALCYSYEAFSLAPTPAQVSAHARLLLGLNLFDTTLNFLEAQAALASEPLAAHVAAFARYAKGDYKKALELEDSALSRAALAPEIAQEMNVAWFVIKQRIPDQGEPSEETLERMRELHEAAVQYRERNPYELVFWPESLRSALGKVGEVVPH